MPATLLLLLGGVLLYIGGEALVRGAAGLALRLGLTPLAVGLTVVAFGTSMPEMTVSVGAAVRGLDDVALGNVVGSNVANVALILGLAAVIRPISTNLQLLRLDLPAMLGATALLAVMLVDGVLDRFEAAVLVACLVAYTWWVLRVARRESAAVKHEFGEAVPRPGRLPVQVGLVIVGIAVLVAGGQLFVDGAVRIASALGVSQAVIALSVVALGTSLPELATSVVASVRRQGDIAVGNVVGSNIFNALGIVGVTGLVRPLGMTGVTWVDIGAMGVVSAGLFLMLLTSRRLTRIEGVALLACYVAYVAWLFGR